ncbi:MAG: dynamin family protein [Proteobacteria bacterium]|nr:dynamin family protein [Pseudomonadota bacterium]MBU4469518.1 dynamin family protein [Pseudomonadota bacterium]MCG2753400.1 dynamin family protein [Desulfobacteraceae bacterium]
MYRENYINSLRSEILEMVERFLSPVALRYGYSDAPLEANIKWRPLVLLLGNYSSGKSTLINEFADAEIQATGQAPTDDSFTIITYAEAPDNPEKIRVIEERDGKFLLNDPEFPFASMKKHGQRFASHFRLKKVNSPFLKDIAIIDTPGMLDSITERDRGYNYQDVIGDFAYIADLVLVLFDPHKAGTVREAYTSLRDTLPSRTFEDRVLYVLNRIDECESLIDLLRVYGTLCWNLSQMTGRKDIPMIHLTYSSRASNKMNRQPGTDLSHLQYLENQREELRKAILQAPRHRLDNLASFVETHGERLSHLLEALMNYQLLFRKASLKYALTGIGINLIFGAGAMLGLMTTPVLAGMDPLMLGGTGAAIFSVTFSIWMLFFKKYYDAWFHKKALKNINDLTSLDNQTRRDTWETVKSIALKYLQKTQGKYSLKEVKKEYTDVRMVFEKGTHDIREALNELATVRNEGVKSEE